MLPTQHGAQTRLSNLGEATLVKQAHAVNLTGRGCAASAPDAGRFGPPGPLTDLAGAGGRALGHALVLDAQRRRAAAHAAAQSRADDAALPPLHARLRRPAHAAAAQLRARGVALAEQARLVAAAAARAAAAGGAGGAAVVAALVGQAAAALVVPARLVHEAALLVGDGAALAAIQKGRGEWAAG